MESLCRQNVTEGCCVNGITVMDAAKIMITFREIG
jgi:hypothetical protein